MTDGWVPAFTGGEYRARLDALRGRMTRRGIETLLVFAPENVCYLTGYETIGFSSFQTCIVRPDAILLFIREMERTVAETTCWIDQFETFTDSQDPGDCLTGVLRARGWLGGPVGIELEGGFVTPGAVDRLRAGLGAVGDASGIVEEGRRIKSAAEVELIRRACRVTEAGMAAALGAIRVGVTEDDVAAAAYAAMLGAGSDFFAGDPIVTSGWRSGVAHFTFGHRGLEAGDTVLIELGGCLRRYFGPLMRSAALEPVGGEVHAMAATIIAALDAAIGAIRPGATSGEVDEACRTVLEDAGYEPYFRKRTGYSVGVGFAPDWGEGHIVSLRRDDPTPLEPGMVFHMPPALRVPRRYGLGWSETVAVTAGGCEVLTQFPRSLHVVGGRP